MDVRGTTTETMEHGRYKATIFKDLEEHQYLCGMVQASHIFRKPSSQPNKDPPALNPLD